MVKNYKNVKVKVSSGGIRTITIDHPKTYNSLSFETLRSLLNIFKMLDKDMSAKLVFRPWQTSWEGNKFWSE